MTIKQMFQLLALYLLLVGDDLAELKRLVWKRVYQRGA